MRQFFLDSITRLNNSPSAYALMRRLALRSHATALEYHSSKRREDHPFKEVSIDSRGEKKHLTSNVSNDLSKIKTGQKQAVDYQHLVAKILHETFTPQLDEPLRGLK
jgi:hypothetical protein